MKKIQCTIQVWVNCTGWQTNSTSTQSKTQLSARILKGKKPVIKWVKQVL
jgi:hypothetical protein